MANYEWDETLADLHTVTIGQGLINASYHVHVVQKRLQCALQVAIDFSNLESVVLSALADIPKLQVMADEAHRRVVGTVESFMAHDVAAMLHKVIT